MVPNELIEKMRRDWDRRAVENHRYYIVNTKTAWSDEEFWTSGETNVSQYVLTDMGNVCQGRRPADMRVLDFGCGAGRVTRALAKEFGEVCGVDIRLAELTSVARWLASLDTHLLMFQTSTFTTAAVRIWMYLGGRFLTSLLRFLFSTIFLAA